MTATAARTGADVSLEPSLAPPARTGRRPSTDLGGIGAALGIWAITAVLRPWGVALKGAPVLGELLAWDATWYLTIAEHGYQRSHTADADAVLAFFPLFPIAVRIVHDLSPLGYRPAALLVANAAAAAAVVALFLLARELTDRRTALFVVALFATQPLSVVLSMGYSESLFVALALGALLAVRREAWLDAGMLAAGAGLARSIGIAVALAVVVAGAVAFRSAATSRARMSIVGGSLLACAGTPAYLLWVGHRTGRLDGWQRVQQAGWGTRWDWGAETRRFLAEALLRAEDWLGVSTALLLVLAVVATTLALIDRSWPPLAVYSATVVILTLGQSNFFHSKLRLLVPAVLALFPLAKSLARAKPANAYVALGLIAAFGLWYGSFMTATWNGPP